MLNEHGVPTLPQPLPLPLPLALPHSLSPAVYALFRAFIAKIVRYTSISVPDKEFVESNFFRLLKGEIEYNLYNRRLFQLPSGLPPNLQFSLQLVEIFSSQDPNWLDSHGTGLVRLCQRLLADHITRSAKLIRVETGTGDLDNDPILLNYQPTSSISIYIESTNARRTQIGGYKNIASTGAGTGTGTGTGTGSSGAADQGPGHGQLSRPAFGIGTGPMQDAFIELTMCLQLLLKGAYI